MSILYKPVQLEHYDNGVILAHPNVQAFKLDSRTYTRKWNLELFDLKSVMPEFYEWCEDFFSSKITVTRFFVTIPNSTTIVHEDGGYVASLNIPVINCSVGSKNVWYSVDETKKPQDPSWKHDAHTVDYVANDGAAYVFQRDAIKAVIDQTVLDTPLLFCANVAHNVVAGKLEEPNWPRIVLSVRTENMRKSSNMSFEDLTNFLGL